MRSSKNHAVLSDALRSTVALWLFVLLVFLPAIIKRHTGEDWTGVAIDCSTILVSMGFAMLMFLTSRATIGLPYWTRLPLRAASVLFFACVHAMFDLLFQGWLAD